MDSRWQSNREREAARNVPNARPHREDGGYRASTGDEKILVLGELTEEQKQDPDKYKQLELNSITLDQLSLTNNRYIHFDLAAPDIMNWLRDALIDLAIADLRIDDKAWKLNYQTDIDIEIPSIDIPEDNNNSEDVSDLLFDH